MAAQKVLKRGYIDAICTIKTCTPALVSSAAHWTSGDAEAIFRRAEATAKGLCQISAAITANGGNAAASMRIAEQVQT